MVKVLQISNNEIGQIIEPELIPFAFTAIGWKLIVLVLFITTILLSILYFHRFIRNRYRREAIVSIVNLNSVDNSELYEVAKILKKLAIDVYGRSNVANLTGSNWINFLNSKVKKQCYDLDLTLNVYASLNNTDGIVSDKEKRAFIEQSIYWIKKHSI